MQFCDTVLFFITKALYFKLPTACRRTVLTKLLPSTICSSKFLQHDKFCIKIVFALTINMAQGQTLERDAIHPISPLISPPPLLLPQPGQCGVFETVLI